MIARIAGTMFFAAVVIALFLIGAIVAHAQSPEARKQFFADAKRAEMHTGKKPVNCCGEGDATMVKQIATSRDGRYVAVEILAPMRHPTAKKGEVVTVPIERMVKWPRTPEGMGTILFLSVEPEMNKRRPYCLVQKRTGG